MGERMREFMANRVRGLVRIAAVCGAVAALALGTGLTAMAAERFVHVRVDSGVKGENVNVNLPLSVAEKVLPAINRNGLHDGRVTIPRGSVNGIDVHALLDAVVSSPDSEIVRVKNQRQEVHIAKSKGSMIVQVRDENGKQDVEVRIPVSVVTALLSTAKQNELDVEAALRALEASGETLAVTVHNASQQVRIWVDSNSNAD